MDVNADFKIRVSVHAAQDPWMASPMPGVERRMLDRLGDEVGRATTIVRYAPGSSFFAHSDPGGEEFIVIDGVFQDEHGDFTVGSYVRNPPNSRHTPSAAEGATIMVKLWQFDPEDRQTVRLQTQDMAAEPVSGCEGVSAIPLYKDAREHVRIEIWDAGTVRSVDGHKGFEVFVLEGGFAEGNETFGQDSWLRLPVGHAFECMAGPEGARVWIKSEHLAETPTRPALESPVN